MNDKFPNWHYTSKGDYPENYRECIRYTLKCSEYTPKVLCITKTGKCRLYFRNRKIDEADFKWLSNTSLNSNNHDNPNVIVWTFLPSVEYKQKILKQK